MHHVHQHRHNTSSVVLLTLVVAVKLSYGPLAALMSTLKVQSFPTEFRASAFGVVTLLSKVGTILAPTIAEVFRGEGTWDTSELASYIAILSAGIGASGLLTL